MEPEDRARNCLYFEPRGFAAGLCDGLDGSQSAGADREGRPRRFAVVVSRWTLHRIHLWRRGKLPDIRRRCRFRAAPAIDVARTKREPDLVAGWPAPGIPVEPVGTLGSLANAHRRQRPAPIDEEWRSIAQLGEMTCRWESSRT